MRRVAGLLLTIGGLTIIGGFLAVAALFMSAGMESEDNTTQAASVSMCTITGPAPDDSLTTEQQDNARIIVEVGIRRGIAPRGLVIAIATALQESGLRNLAGGDRDSAGLFQQRPSTGWGTHAQATDPAYAANAFYGGPDHLPANPGLLDIAGWEQVRSRPPPRPCSAPRSPTYAKTRHVPPRSSKPSPAPPRMRAARSRRGSGCSRSPKAPRLTSGYGPRTHPIRGTVDFHAGLDMAAPQGTPVVAVTDGEVISAGVGGGYGNLVKLRHANGVESWYAHLSAISVQQGQPLQTGDELGRVGSTGSSTGPPPPPRDSPRRPAHRPRLLAELQGHYAMTGRIPALSGGGTSSHAERTDRRGWRVRPLQRAASVCQEQYVYWVITEHVFVRCCRTC